MVVQLNNLYIPLRIYSDYSLGKSTISISKLVECCKEKAIPAVALTEYGNMFSALEFAMECTKHGIQPISGISINVQSSHCTENGELLLLAKNAIGLQNLLKLASMLHVDLSSDSSDSSNNNDDHDKSSLSLPWSILKTHSEGLICLSGSINSIVARKCFDKKLYNAKQELLALQKAGLEVFIELSRYLDNRHQFLERELLSLALDLNIPIVATNPTQFIHPQDKEVCDTLICILEGRYLNEENRDKVDASHYLKSKDEMHKLFQNLPEAIENTVLIARKCSVIMTPQKAIFPKFIHDIDQNDLLEEYAKIGLEERIQYENNPDIIDIYNARLYYELGIIQDTGFAGYFLIVSDFIKWSKQQGIAVGPGRGSGVGSIVAWALQITELDPIKFGLLFERFLNPDRISIPDFDIDFCQLRRDEVINYVKTRYGKDKVAHIITFGKLQARAAIRDVGRVLQIPYSLVDRICKMVPVNPANPITLKEAIEMDKGIQKLRDDDSDIKKLLELALSLEGINRHASTHAAGLVIADKPIIELAPLYKVHDSNSIVVQYNMKYCEAAGLVKFDFLGLKTLTIIVNTQNLLKKRNIIVDFHNSQFKDKNTYKMLSDGRSIGVFQFESFGMREAIKKIKPDCIEDLIALVSLYRPGPMENLPNYIKRKHGYEKIDHIHPLLEQILKETYGIIIYQEQVMEIARTIAGYTLGQADILRRAMGKKNKDEMEGQRKTFIDGAIKNGLSRLDATEIFELIYKFASYGFNKSHAAAYAVISYQTAYLKANYTHEFIASCINLEIDDTDKISILCNEAKQFGITISPPRINSSSALFTIEEQENKDLAIRFGLGGIKNVSTKIMEEVVEERIKNGNFSDIFNFAKRCASFGINRRFLESLANADVFADICNNTAEIIENSEIIIKYAHNCSTITNIAHQRTIFNMLEEEEEKINLTKLLKTPHWSRKNKLDAEYSALGFYLTDHPLMPYKEILSKAAILESSIIIKAEVENGDTFKVAGIVLSRRIKSGKGNNKKYAFIQISDHTGIIDFAIFDEEMLIHCEKTNILKEGSLIIVTLTAKVDLNGTRFVATSIKEINSIIRESKNNCLIIIKNDLHLTKLKKILSNIGEKNNSSYLVQIKIKLDSGDEIEFSSKKQIYIDYNDIKRISAIDGLEVVL